MSTLEEFVTNCGEVAARVFERNGKLSPLYVIVDGRGEEHVIPPPSRDKDRSVAMVRAILLAVKATRVAYVDEAWFMETRLELDNRVELERIDREGVRNQPGRKEVILISGEDEEEGAIMYRREIVRDGDRAWLGEVLIERFDYSEGRMIGLLPVKKGKAH